MIDLKTQLINNFQVMETQLNGKSKTAFHQLRKEALERFDILGFPTIRHEEWKYSNVKNIISQSYNFNTQSNVTSVDLEVFTIPKLGGNVLYVVNGIYQEKLSHIISDEAVLKVCNLADAEALLPEVFATHFGKYANYRDNAFTALNTAFAQNGIVIYVPNNKVVEEVVTICYVTDARHENIATQPRNLVVLGENAQLKVVQTFVTLGDSAAFSNVVLEAFVSENAHFECYQLQNESDNAYQINTTQIEQKSNSVSYNFTISLNGGFVRNNLNARLDGEYCEANMFGVYLPNGSQHIDNHTVVDHAKPNSNSNELYKGILSDRSTGVFNGKIFVREDAQKTNAFQSCKNVLLSDNATMNTKPQLEIWADDVKCSHGTTTGQLNNDALFYLQARGIPKDAARTLLMLAFAEDVINKIKIEPLKVYLEGLIEGKIN
jgi:Fe-S cluster assembly protein SufD